MYFESENISIFVEYGAEKVSNHICILAKSCTITTVMSDFPSRILDIFVSVIDNYGDI
jgi:hypothetical protein